MPGTAPGAQSGPGSTAALVALVVMVAWLGLRLPFQLHAAAATVPGDLVKFEAALRVAPARLVEVAAGITPAMVEILRQQADGDPVVVYGPATPEAEAWVRLMFERLKNLTYPRPREFAYALGVDGPQGLARFVTQQNENRLLVLDYSQSQAELPIAAQFEEAGRGLHMRFWKLRKAARR